MAVVDCNTLRRFAGDDRLFAILSALGSWTPLDDLGEAGLAVSEAGMDRLVTLGLVEERGDPVYDGSRQDQLYWSPFELAVQRQLSTGGYSEAAVRSRGTSPPPLFKIRPPGPVTGLPPCESTLPVSLGNVLGARRSIRTYADRSLRLTELSAVLGHSFRIVQVVHDDLLGGHAFRPFPGGGARSELEVYVVANDVEGLSPGAYYYDPRSHELVLIRERDQDQARLNRGVHRATGLMLNRDPPAVLVITAVFARVMWKYTGIGLSVIYRNTGCVYQTLYLVATALGLAPCAIGGGEEREHSTWLGLDPLVESEVGCVLIGPRANSVTSD
jgi:SagB-type dehydrogenase family enzyme